MEREPPLPLKPCFPGLVAVSHSEEGKRERKTTTTQERRDHHQLRQHEQEERMRRRRRRRQRQHEQEEMMRRRRRRQQQQQQSAVCKFLQTTGMSQECKNKKRDPLLCKCLAAMGMCRFVDDFDNFTQFIRMSSDQCRLYGPEFVVKYAKLHTRIEALCASAFSMYNDFEPHDAACCDVDGEPVADGQALEVCSHFEPRDAACCDVYGEPVADGQALEVCSHVVGTCDAHEKWVRRNLQN